MWIPRWVKYIVDSVRAEASAVQEAINKQADTAKHENTANREKEQSTIGALRSISDEIKSGNQQADASVEKSYRQQDRLIKLQGRLVLWAALAFFAAFGYGLVALWQGCMMRRTYTEIQKQTNAAICANQTAQRALAQTRDQFRTDLRPYIGLSIAGWEAHSYLVNVGPHKGHMALTLNYANYGKSPAIHFRYNAFIAFGKSASSRVKWHEITEPGTGNIVPPSETKGTAVAYSEDIVTPEKFAEINAAKVPFIFFGHFEYTDMFGNPQPVYTTEFCMASTTTPVLTQSSIEAVCDAHTNMK